VFSADLAVLVAKTMVQAGLTVQASLARRDGAAREALPLPVPTAIVVIWATTAGAEPPAPMLLVSPAGTPPRPLRKSGKVARTAFSSKRRDGKRRIPTGNQTFADFTNPEKELQ
jgi:hypothetical protein